MEQISTKYGILKGISYMDCYADGSIKECKLNHINKLESRYGVLIPQYEDSEARSKHIRSITFYNSGKLRSVYLQNQIEIKTAIGILPAEFITFYENESINRIFPLNGKITAYWTEENEYDLAKEIEFNLSVGKLKEKVISVHFYESGSIKSITFWRKKNMIINTPLGDVSMRIGVSFYSDGKLKSFEPAILTAVPTKIGTIMAYDTEVLGIHGDSNSLKFSRQGIVESLITSTDTIEVTNKKGEKKSYKPLLKQSIINENAVDIVPLNIEFYDNKVKFSSGIHHKFSAEYVIDECNFHIKNSPLDDSFTCSSCTGC